MSDPTTPAQDHKDTRILGGSMSTPTFRFHARVVEKDSSGYYHARWDKARKVSALAHTMDEAIDKIDTMMGENRSGWHWSIIFDSIEEKA